ncbi:MAG: hypothetical protein ABI878_04145 [Acidobacteriota bacterium]
MAGLKRAFDRLGKEYFVEEEWEDGRPKIWYVYNSQNRIKRWVGDQVGATGDGTFDSLPPVDAPRQKDGRLCRGGMDLAGCAADSRVASGGIAAKMGLALSEKHSFSANRAAQPRDRFSDVGGVNVVGRRPISLPKDWGMRRIRLRRDADAHM